MINRAIYFILNHNTFSNGRTSGPVLRRHPKRYIALKSYPLIVKRDFDSGLLRWGGVILMLRLNIERPDVSLKTLAIIRPRE
ncbi:hypothetical protein ACN38_g4303 [Penicillium nordicum]|uniref:Uncharacterized protein n=1 Tax=Penicillium nordicum TaxID=229535 RepID=A0A0M8PC79_9EURO|nr:hypothetical protein ACN38_g4303 [Penicillium nordicum]